MYALCSHKLKYESFWFRFFQKANEVKGEEPLAPSAEGETLLVVRKTQERVNFFAKQRKRENPRRGFSFKYENSIFNTSSVT